MPTPPVDKTSAMAKAPLQDRCWIIPIVAAAVVFLTAIVESSRGYLYVLYMDEFHVDHAAASWPGNAYLASGHLSGILIVVLQSKLSVFVITLLVVGASSAIVVTAAFCPNMACMTVTMGGIYGIGFGATLTSFAIYTLLYFDKYKATGTALKYSAWSASGLAGPLIMSSFANSYGLKGALLLTGGLALNTIPLAMLLKEPRPLKLCPNSHVLHKKRTSLQNTNRLTTISKNQHDQTPAYQSSATTLLSPTASIDKLGLTLNGITALFRIPDFYVLLVVYAVFDWSALLHSTTAVDYGRDKGVSLESATYVLTCNAFGHLVGRSVVPFASDRVPFSHCPFAVASLFSCCFSFIAASYVRSFPAFMAINVLLGVGQGYVTSIRSVLITNYLGVQRLPAFFGFLGLFLIPLALASATILAYFRDTLGSYDNIYRVFGAANLSLAVVLSLLACRDKARRHAWTLDKITAAPSNRCAELPEGLTANAKR